MKIETYIKNRNLFEQRYWEQVKSDNTDFFGKVRISTINKGMRNFSLFFFIYSRDKHIIVGQNVYLIDRDKRYYTFRNHPATKFSLTKKKESFLDRYPHHFDILVKQFQKQKLNEKK